MKTLIWTSIGVLVVVALVIVGLGLGWAVWGRRLWSASPAYALDPRPGYGHPGARPGAGRMWGGPGRWEESPRGSDSDGVRAHTDELELTIEGAREAVEGYLVSRGYDELEVAEVMAFEGHYYAIAAEHDSGIGAMELLVDRESGIVVPEMGPNMMWNEQYGMHRRGMGGDRRRLNRIGQDEAVEMAQRWLDANRPDLAADDHVVPFYGYYTIHALEDGHIEGMLSVHGTTGRVWYHTWHGEFVDAVGEETH